MISRVSGAWRVAWVVASVLAAGCRDPGGGDPSPTGDPSASESPTEVVGATSPEPTSAEATPTSPATSPTASEESPPPATATPAQPTDGQTSEPSGAPTEAPATATPGGETDPPDLTETAPPEETSGPTATEGPTPGSTAAPTVEPTLAPTPGPTLDPTAEPTLAPTAEPTLAPTAEPTLAPTAGPTFAPTAEPTLPPTPDPTPTPPVDLDGDGAVAAVDCDDTDPDVRPGADEVCDGIDNDCDLQIDDADPGVLDPSEWIVDADGDGYGDQDLGEITQACLPPSGYVGNNEDCDDGDPEVHPAAAEVCDGIDNNCDALIDDDDPALVDAPTWYPDPDGDGYGTGEGVTSCTQPPGTVAFAGDCGEGDPDSNPETVWYLDSDQDGFGGAQSTVQCSAPSEDHTQTGGDCNDLDSQVYPGAPEVCDGIDQDCDSSADEGTSFGGAVAWWKGDGDASDSIGDAEGSLSGDATYVAGRAGQAFSFDGSGDYASFGTSILNVGTGNFTIEFWIKTTATKLTGVMNKRPSCNHTNFTDVRMNQTGRLGWELDQDTAATNYIALGSNVAINNGQWRHVALVREGVEARIYVDGVFDARKSAAAPTNLNNTAPFQMGVSTCTGKDGTDWFSGQLDEVTVYARVLSDAEIAALAALDGGDRCVVP